VASPLLGTNTLPTTVDVGGIEVPIEYDYRAGIRFESLIFDRSVPEHRKVALALGIWYPLGLNGADIGKAIHAMLDFYRCGKTDVDRGESMKQLYSYDADYDTIYAGFLQSYGIDLFDTERLHWWRFRAMMTALPSDCQFMRVVGYRGAKIERDMSKEQKAHIRKMKAIYALPHDSGSHPKRLRSRAEYEEALAAVLAAKREGLPC